MKESARLGLIFYAIFSVIISVIIGALGGDILAIIGIGFFTITVVILIYSLVLYTIYSWKENKSIAYIFFGVDMFVLIIICLILNMILSVN